LQRQLLSWIPELRAESRLSRGWPSGVSPLHGTQLYITIWRDTCVTQTLPDQEALDSPRRAPHTSQLPLHRYKLKLFTRGQHLKPILLTSIPPSLRGTKFSTGSPGSMQHYAIASWKSAGLRVVSMHSPTELLRCPHHAGNLKQNGIEVLEVPSTIGGYPDYLPNLQQGCLNLLSKYQGATIAITNADIIFSEPNHTRSLLENICDGSFVVSNRLDINEFPAKNSIGIPNRNGFDFFASSSTALENAIKFLPSVLTFGLPWWDLYFPLAMLAAGAKVRLDDPRFYLHPTHQEGWTGDYWFKIGAIADREFLDYSPRFPPNSYIYNWPLKRKHAVKIKFFSPKFFHRLRCQTKSLIKKRRILPLYLSDIYDLTLDITLKSNAGPNGNNR
jgi:hypothetical protein